MIRNNIQGALDQLPRDLLPHSSTSLSCGSVGPSPAGAGGRRRAGAIYIPSSSPCQIRPLRRRTSIGPLGPDL